MSVRLPLVGRAAALEAIDAARPESPVRMATVNPEFMLDAQKNEAFRNALEQMTHCTVDGSGLHLILALCHRLGRTEEPPERYPGATLVADLIERYQKGEKRFFLLGDKPGVAKKAAEELRKRHRDLAIVGATDGGRIDPAHVHLDPTLIREIEGAAPDILLVGFGAPKQELWIHAASDLKIPTMIGVGGTLGFYTYKKRAPELFQRLYLEWLYRLCTERGHFRRVWRAVVLFPLAALRWTVSDLTARQR